MRCSCVGIILTAIVLSVRCASLFDILHYFSAKNVSAVHIYLCEFSDVLEQELIVSLRSSPLLASLNLMVQNTPIDRLIVDRAMPNRIGISIDIKCPSTKFFLNRCSEKEMFSGSHAWLVWSSLEEGIKVLDQLKLAVNTDLTLASWGHPQKQAFSIHKILYNSSIIYTPIDMKAPHKEIVRDFRGNTIDVAIVTDITLREGESIADLSNQMFRRAESSPGHRATLLQYDALKETLNMRYRYWETKSWGSDTGNGTWNGYMGLLQSRKAEISLHFCKLRKDRMDIAEVFSSIQQSRSLLLFVQKPQFGSYKALVVPLTYHVWISLGVTCIFFIVMYRFISLFDDSQDFNNWGAIIILTIGTLAQQGFNDTTRMASSRIVCFCLLIFSFMAFLYYGAAVLNGLLSPTLSSIKTVKQILDTDMPIIILDENYMHDFNTDEGVFGPRDAETLKLFSQFAESGSKFLKMDEGLKSAMKGGVIFFADNHALYTAMSQTVSSSEMCSFVMIPKNFPFQAGISARKGSPYKEIITVIFARLMETGMNERIKSQWYDKKPACTFKLEAISIGMEGATVAFLVLLAGFILSALVFAQEFYSTRVKS